MEFAEGFVNSMASSLPTTGNATPVPVNEHGTNHMHLLGRKLFELREEDAFCDVTIKVESRAFKAHRAILAAASDYFRAMFRGGFQEQTSAEVNIHGKSDIFEDLLEFVYTGNFHVSPDDVIDVFEMSNYLQIQHATGVCADYLAQHLQDSSTAGSEIPLDELARMISLAMDAKHDKLEEAAYSYVKAKLSWICKQADFAQNMPVEVLLKVLDQKEDLSYLFSEDQVLTLTVQWLNHNWESRKKHTNQLLKKIRLGVIPIDRLKGVFTATMQEVPGCKELLEKVLELNATRETSPVPLSYSHPNIFASRGTITALISIGGYEDQTESCSQYFDDKEDSWIPLEKFAQLPYSEIIDQSAVVVNGNLYIAGGQVSVPNTTSHVRGKNFHRYCERTNTWVDLPNMHDARDHFPLAHLGNYIYAIGGHRDFGDLLSYPWVKIERYNLDLNRWEKLPHQPWGSFKPMAVVYKGKVLLYGPDEYDDSPGEHCTYYLMVFYPDTLTWKTVWRDTRTSGHRQSILTVVEDICYEIRFVIDHRTIPVVRELVLDLEADVPSVKLGSSEDQSSIECNEVCIKGDLYAILTFPGYVHKKPKGQGSWFHSSNIDGASASVVSFTFDRLRLL